nr:caleosin-related, EF-hand domain pair [Tanacetum cinerariifolium]
MNPNIESDQNVLQKHAAFFDRNKDGVIYPWETYQGFRAIGSGILLSSVAAIFINVSLSGNREPKDYKGWIGGLVEWKFLHHIAKDNNGVLDKDTIKAGNKLPNLLFPIYIENIHLAKHGSDSGVYDTHGRFVHSKFEEIFHKHAHTNSGALTADELNEFVKGNREPKDYKGWIGGLVEWKFLHHIAKDNNGVLDKDTIKAVYDGSLFEKLAEQKTNSAKKKHT